MSYTGADVGGNVTAAVRPDDSQRIFILMAATTTRTKVRKGYFYEREEQAVVDYIKAPTKDEKDRVFRTILRPAFTKMIESIINRYKLYPPDEEFQHTFDDTLSFLMSKIDRFDPSKNCKAYSYCGKVCKNYLIHKIEKVNKHNRRYPSYDGYPDGVLDGLMATMTYDRDDTDTVEFLGSLINETVKRFKRLLEKKEELKLKENEVIVGQALVELMTNWEEVFLTPSDSEASNKFNKSSILLYLRELTNLSTKEIRESMKRYKTAYYDAKKSLVECGLEIEDEFAEEEYI